MIFSGCGGQPYFFISGDFMEEQYRLIGRKKDDYRQKDDFYPTPEYVTRALLKHHKFIGTIWECACGDGRMAEVLEKAGYKIVPTDLIDRGYSKASKSSIDFLLENTRMENIVTNPPFNLAYEFIEQGLRLSTKCLALFLPIRYLTGKKRAELYKEFPPTKIIVIPNKVDFLGNANPVMEFAWFIWEKGVSNSEILWAEWGER